MNCRSDFFAFFFLAFGADVSALGLSGVGLGLSTAKAGIATASPKALAAIKAVMRNDVMVALLAAGSTPSTVTHSVARNNNRAALSRRRERCCRPVHRYERRVSAPLRPHSLPIGIIHVISANPATRRSAIKGRRQCS